MFVPRRASRASRSKRGAATIVDADLNGRGRNTVGETMRMLREEKGRRKPLHAPSHATPGGKTTKTRKKKEKTRRRRRRRGKSKSQKPRRASTAKNQKHHQAGRRPVVSDRPHQNKTTVLTWLGPGTTEAGGGKGERGKSGCAGASAKRVLSRTQHAFPLWGSWNASLSLTSIRTCAATCGCAYLLPALHVRTWVREGGGGYLSPKRPSHPLSPTSLLVVY